MPEWVNTVLPLAGGAGVSWIGLYYIFRMLRKDSNSDQLDGKAKAIIDAQERQLTSEREANAWLHKEKERVSQERNDAIQKMGRMEGEIHSLTKEVSRLREELTAVKVEMALMVKLLQQCGIELHTIGQKIVFENSNENESHDQAG